MAAAGCGGHGGSGVGDDASQPTTALTTRPAPATERPAGAIDRLVAVGDDAARIHLVCAGSGESTVVLISGFGGGVDAWTAVAPSLEDQARVCTSDRPGIGRSEAPGGNQTFVSEAEDLHTVLETAGELGPYVIAGHSFGGAEAVAFADRFADEVVGLMLVDASPTTWPTAACGVGNDGSAVARSFIQACGMFEPSGNPERLDVRRAFGEVAEVRSLGDLPMTILTRAEANYPGLSVAANASLAATWKEGQSHWATLSTDSDLVPVNHTGHAIQVDQPQVVIDHLHALLDAS